MNDQQLEKLLVGLLEKFDEKSEEFKIALYQREERFQPRWYSPRQLVLRFLRAGVSISGPDIQAALVIAHGAIDVLGFGGTTKLILALRRKHGSRIITTKKKDMPDLRNGA